MHRNGKSEPCHYSIQAICLSMLVEDKTHQQDSSDNLVEMTNEDFITAKLLDSNLAEKLEHRPWDSDRVKYYT
jgi:hypothetical protein